MVSVHSPIEQRNTGKGNPNAIEHFERPPIIVSSVLTMLYLTMIVESL